MFSFFKRKTPTEADFDVLRDVEVHGLRITKAEIAGMFMTWSNDPRRMSKRELGRLIELKSAAFKAKYGQELIARQSILGTVYADHVIKALKALKVIVVTNKSNGTYKICKRGEQIRQFYVLKNGLSGTIYDRMDRFA